MVHATRIAFVERGVQIDPRRSETMVEHRRRGARKHLAWREPEEARWVRTATGGLVTAVERISQENALKQECHSPH